MSLFANAEENIGIWIFSKQNTELHVYIMVVLLQYALLNRVNDY